MRLTLPWALGPGPRGPGARRAMRKRIGAPARPPRAFVGPHLHPALGALAGSILAPGGRPLAGAIAGAVAARPFAARLEARRAAAASDAVDRELPVMLERMGSALRTGCSLDAAVRLVAPGTEGPLGVSLREAVVLADLGCSRSEMLERASRVPGRSAQRAFQVMRRSDRLGTPMAAVVGALASEVRAAARARAETDARTAPVRMLFPLALCFLPAFVLLAIAPIALSAARTLGGL